MSSHFFRCDPRVVVGLVVLDRSKIIAGTNHFFFSISASLRKLINARSSLRGLSKKFPTLIRNVSPESP